MLASDHPGCCGVAATLPQKPGTQKVMPPSSAKALFVDAAATSASAPQRQDAFRVFIRCMLCLPRLFWPPPPRCLLQSCAEGAPAAPIPQPLHVHSRPLATSHYASLDRSTRRGSKYGGL